MENKTGHKNRFKDSINGKYLAWSSSKKWLDAAKESRAFTDAVITELDLNFITYEDEIDTRDYLIYDSSTGVRVYTATSNASTGFPALDHVINPDILEEFKAQKNEALN